MSVGVTEKRVLYDNPCAPIVKFSSNHSHLHTNDEFDDDDEEEDMTDDRLVSSINHESLLNPALGSLERSAWIFSSSYTAHSI